MATYLPSCDLCYLDSQPLVLQPGNTAQYLFMEYEIIQRPKCSILNGAPQEPEHSNLTACSMFEEGSLHLPTCMIATDIKTVGYMGKQQPTLSSASPMNLVWRVLRTSAASNWVASSFPVSSPHPSGLHTRHVIVSVHARACTYHRNASATNAEH